jgi:hypothetical protein
MRSFIRPLFLVVLVVALVLALIKPSLFPGVLAGVAVALVCALLPTGLSPRARKIVAAVAGVVVVIVVVAVLASGGSEKKHRPPPRERAIGLTTTLRITGEYTSKQSSISLTDTLTIDSGEFAKAVGSPLLPADERKGLSPAKLANGVTAGLRSQGWRTQTSSRGVTARRLRAIRVKQHTVFPGVSKNKIPVSKPTRMQALVPGAGRASFLAVAFTVSDGSFVIKAPQYLISSTDPSSDAKPTTAKRDSRMIALDPSVDQIAFDVRSKAFRNGALHSVTSWTTWTPLKWILGLLVALSNDAVRERIRRLFKRGSGAEAEA